ncbi:PaaI family thioesterase [Pseudonocardia sp. N23]|uniref:PaaI family thioesterase n=1 Tax=Pseudonocardia sp. N23 TaxID=1987376 RepID=UPI000BFE2816|nr:PaaI family thioesterase [Pseudonocardia sp. N23]
MAADDPTEFLHSAAPFAALIGVVAVAASPDEVHLRLEWDPTRTTTAGLMHGGAIMALADTAGGWAALLNLPETATGTATISSSANFMRPCTEGHVDAVAHVLHKGRTTIVVDTELRDAKERLVAKVTQTQAILT